MRMVIIFTLVLLLFAGCINVGAEENKAGTLQKQEKKTDDLNISDSDLVIDEPVIDPTIDDFEIERP